MKDAVITATGLTKYFGRKCVVDEVSFAVPRGSVTAFLGRNGSGKTTTLRMLLGLLEPTRGSSTLLGEDSQKLPAALRGAIGYLAENHPLINWMTVKQSAEFQSAFFPNWNDRIFNATVEHFALEPKAKAGSLSRGQRAGLALALTLAPEPDLLILDDPALGLDPCGTAGPRSSRSLYITRDPNRTVPPLPRTCSTTLSASPIICSSSTAPSSAPPARSKNSAAASHTSSSLSKTPRLRSQSSPARLMCSR